GGIAERQAGTLGVPVLRVDRPMAAEAARYRRIVVVAALRSTLEPTVALIAEEAGPETPRIDTVVVEGAWALFEAGDRDGYLDAVAAAVDGVPPAEDGVVVLAQASSSSHRRPWPTPSTGRPPRVRSWRVHASDSPTRPARCPVRAARPATDPKDGARRARRRPPGHPGEGGTRRPRGP
ncbi:hypothetical protein ACWCQ0_50295, partial [Streptomyces massasporeus]